ELVAEETGALVIDTRDAAEFCKGFVPRSINIGIKGDFAPWLGTLVVDVKQPILVVTEKGKEEEVITRMSRVGFDHVVGHLKGGIDTWIESGKEIDHVERISSEEFKEQFVPGQSKVLDLRKEGEYAAEHVQDAYNRPLAYINDWIKEINTNEHFYIHCAAGYRSMIAASILQSRGYRNFSEIEGGFNAIKQTNVPMTDFICQSKVMAV
ncbi:MAG: rhodanese-like domain-containing protein, partial [Chitinophagaceae bacterium]|nr:rhodanese-like domain-containing protein [Chitinophagaceae bacterium]